ncbi:MAG TPA: RluA family pseudouridine synthase [Rhodocyclaceae bacterium]|nr:RluA family pseudouridine synthase [Rhodocyclaceae bacterium]
MSEFQYRPPEWPGFRVLHVSRQLLVLDKAAGLLTVPGRGDDRSDCLLSRVQMEFPDAMIVHRLDLATSGIVVMARGPQNQSRLSVLFQERRVSKHYQARVHGVWTGPMEGEINQPLCVDWPNRPRQKIDLQAGRPSLTRYRVLSIDETSRSSRVELEPVTGRSHQLRVHLEYLGYPILGDDLYGTRESREASARLMLHACLIEFPNPVTGKPVRVDSPPPF